MTNWPVKTLGEVCDLVGGGTPSKDRPEFYGGEIPWATVRDLNVEVLRSTEHSITAEAVKSSSSNIIPSGSVVIATRVGLGKAVIVAQDTAINQDLRGLVVKKPKELLAEYLYWWYLSTVHLVVAAGTGATVQGVKLPFVSGLAIPVPPLEEQKRIVELLDAATSRVTELTACYEQARTHANNLFISASREVFEGNPDWPVRTLGDVCEVLDSLRKPITKRDRTSGDYPYYGATGIVDYVGDYIFDERLVLVGEDGAKWDAGDRTAFIVEGRYWVNNHAHVLRCRQGVLVDSWLANFLTMSDLNRFVSGLTVPKLNQGSLVSIEIPVPPLEEQKRIVALLDSMRVKTSEMVAAYDAKLVAAKNLRQSVLEAAFAGEL